MELKDVIAFIVADATEGDLVQISAATKARRDSLARVAGASVTIGSEVEIHNLSPKYLNGLCGTVAEHRGKAVAVELDEQSTALLKLRGARRFFIRSDETRFNLTGVPARCVRAVEA